jgi:hypothetical protein
LSIFQWVTKNIGPCLVESVEDMYKKYIYPYESKLFYRQKKLFAFEEYTNSTQEAYFSTTKAGALAVLPTMDLDTSPPQLNNKADRKAAEYIIYGVRWLNTTDNWNGIPDITSKLAPYGAGLVETEYNLHYDYNSKPWELQRNTEYLT